MKVKTVNIDIKSRERTLLETVDGRVLSLEIENINANDLLFQEDYENGFRAFFAPLTGMSRDEFTMDGTPCNCTGSSILSKKAHSFRGGMNCDQ